MIATQQCKYQKIRIEEQVANVFRVRIFWCDDMWEVLVDMKKLKGDFVTKVHYGHGEFLSKAVDMVIEKANKTFQEKREELIAALPAKLKGDAK